jgi:hypothetical protein
MTATTRPRQHGCNDRDNKANDRNNKAATTAITWPQRLRQLGRRPQHGRDNSTATTATTRPRQHGRNDRDNKAAMIATVMAATMATTAMWSPGPKF